MESITQEDILIATADGPMRAYVARPASARPAPAAIVIHHIAGLSTTMKLVADRVARLGHVCIVPSLYHRLGEIVVDPVDPEPAIAAIRAIAVGSVTPASLRADIGATLAWLAADPGVAAGPRGLIAFGGGAGQAIRVAADFPDAFRAVVGILSVGIVRAGDPDSPHLRIGTLSGGAYFAFAEQDHIIPPAAVDDLRAALAGTRLDHTIVVHPLVRHGYIFSDRPVYDAAAAETDWEAVRRLFARHLADTAKE